MPDTDGPEARHVAERASAAVAGLAHPMTDGSSVHVTCSVGLALHPRDGRTGRALLQAADAAMYTDKRARSSLGRRPRRGHGGHAPDPEAPPDAANAAPLVAADLSQQEPAGTL
jgi:GGDEF domain-containing protein